MRANPTPATYEPDTPKTAEEEAHEIAFGLDKPEPKPYIVHVYGPDDIYEFDSWLEAVEFAAGWNESAVEYVTRRFAEEGAEPPYLTKAWATPYTRQHALDAGVIL